MSNDITLEDLELLEALEDSQEPDLSLAEIIELTEGF